MDKTEGAFIRIEMIRRPFGGKLYHINIIMTEDEYYEYLNCIYKEDYINILEKVITRGILEERNNK